MRLGRSVSMGLVGLEATPVEVEASIGGGLPRTVIVGLPDTALYEARDRCRAAIGSAGLGWPTQLVTINLSPASLPKAGSHYDLAIASAVLAAAGTVPEVRLTDLVLLGELGLDGRVREVRGVLPAVMAARRHGLGHVVVPAAQAREARLVEGPVVHPVSSLRDLVGLLRGEPVVVPEPDEPAGEPADVTRDLADVHGQVEGRWALEVAAAGAHHLFLAGPPGVGKTLLAERLPGILPDLSDDQALEVSAIRSLVGQPVGSRLCRRPPYAAPHHSASVASLVGGGARIASPGAVSQAHRGVLFLDEAPEFSPRALEALRTPLESGRIVLARAQARTTYPARFQLVLAANPCPCGQWGAPGDRCVCAPLAVRRYVERLSGPILDRVDITVRLRPMSSAYLRSASLTAEGSLAVAARVADARERQAERLAPHGWASNAEVPGAVLRRDLPLPIGVELVERAVARGQLSARGVDKVVRIAWTIADLAGASRPSTEHLRAALSMRRGEEDQRG